MRQSDLDRMLTQWVIQEMAIAVLALLVTLGLLYLVIRWGVRDGMRDAQQGLRTGRTPARERSASTAHLPDFKAD